MIAAPAIPQESKIENSDATKFKTTQPLTPESLFTTLMESPRSPIPTLCADFNCSVDTLLKMLEDPAFLKHLKLQTQLAYIQCRLAAARHLPDALQETINILHHSDKPEVRRRAAVSLMQIAGIPIRTASQPAPAPIPDPAPDTSHLDPDPTDDSAFAAELVADELSDEGINFSHLPKEDLLNGLRSLYLDACGKPRPVLSRDEGDQSIEALDAAARLLVAEGIHLDDIDNDQLREGLRQLYIAKRGTPKPKPAPGPVEEGVPCSAARTDARTQSNGPNGR